LRVGLCTFDVSLAYIFTAIGHAELHRARFHAQGDVLLGINGQLVVGQPIEAIKPFILGPIGTPIELFIQRGV